MSRYDDLFDETANRESVFAVKGELDPLRAPTEIVPREEPNRDSTVPAKGGAME